VAKPKHDRKTACFAIYLYWLGRSSDKGNNHGLLKLKDIERMTGISGGWVSKIARGKV
jgi:hypothetical protein